MVNKVSISTLPFDFCELPTVFTDLKNAGVDYAHCDIMDGKFVKNATYTPKNLREIADKMPLPLDVHLMVQNPLEYIEVLQGKVKYFTFHCEVFSNIDELKNAIDVIKSYDVKIGIVVDLNTKVDYIDSVLNDIDLVLVMSVKAGAGGQQFDASAIDKIAYLNDCRKRHNYKFEIEVDGGINDQNVALCVNAGADIVVSGSFVANSVDVQKAIMSLKIVR